MVPCLNAATHIEDAPVGSKHFALNATQHVVLTVATVSSEKKIFPGSEVLEFQADIQINTKGKVIPLQARCGPEGG